MTPVTFENVLSRERVICPDLSARKWVDGIEYLAVRREHNPRIVLMRRDTLKPVKTKDR